MDTLVITSLNPGSDLDYQLSCFNAWLKRGYDAYSFNSNEEAERLLPEMNGQRDRVWQIPESETGMEFFSRPVPGILALLDKARHMHYSSVLLVNADIYPAHHKPVSPLLAARGRAFAFTRTECFDLELSDPLNPVCYRGGLDAFWFQREALEELVGRLETIPSARRMAFGIPGWDYLLGHLLVHELGGMIADAPILLHRAHATTYGDINEFSLHAGVLADSGHYFSSEPLALAEEFHRLIESQCKQHSGFSRLLGLVLYRRADVGSKTTDSTAAVLEEYRRLISEQGLQAAFPDDWLRVFIDNQLRSQGWSGVAQSMVAMAPCRARPRQLLVQLLLLAWLVRESRHGTSLTCHYPADNLHTVALQQILDSCRDGKRDEDIFDLFASELVNYGIINRNLMKYLYSGVRHLEDKRWFDVLIRALQSRD